MKLLQPCIGQYGLSQHSSPETLANHLIKNHFPKGEFAALLLVSATPEVGFFCVTKSCSSTAICLILCFPPCIGTFIQKYNVLLSVVVLFTSYGRPNDSVGKRSTCWFDSILAVNSSYRKIAPWNLLVIPHVEFLTMWLRTWAVFQCSGNTSYACAEIRCEGEEAVVSTVLDSYVIISALKVSCCWGFCVSIISCR